MGIEIKKLRDSRGSIIFDKGKFDEWCVYVIEPNKSKKAPFDIEYFSALKTLAQVYGNTTIYRHFVQIYEQTEKTPEEKILILIEKLADAYEPFHRLEIEKWFTVLYAGMIAEENKKHSILGKRIKRLAMHQIFLEGIPPREAVVFSRNKKWRELDALMKQRGF